MLRSQDTIKVEDFPARPLNADTWIEGSSVGASNVVIANYACSDNAGGFFFPSITCTDHILSLEFVLDRPPWC